ncbi:MAG: murein L,D-transpeptidase, partial [Chitinophagaceae bacterium]
SKGDPVDPYSVNWAKYKKGIPYLVRQSSGDNNALGVIKFNFPNSHAVYLHDTNQRYLFKNKDRSLSHGCVRVQDWEKLAFYIVRNDSLHSILPDSMKLKTDSITAWISRKEKHTMAIKKKFPVFIRYFGCEAGKEAIKFYDDIYGEDKKLRDKYFAQN